MSREAEEGEEAKTSMIIYLPKELKEALKPLAKKQTRSVNNLVVHLLTEYVQKNNNNNN